MNNAFTLSPFLAAVLSALALVVTGGWSQPQTSSEAMRVNPRITTNAKLDGRPRALPVAYSSGSVTTEGSTRETDVLQPSGAVNFPNGSSVIAPPGAFTGEPIVVYSEKVPANAITLPVPDDLIVVGEYFRIGTIGENITAFDGATTFKVTLPIPANEDVNNLGVAALLPENDYYADAEYWLCSAPGRSSVLNGKPYSTPADLFRDGTMFVLVRYPPLRAPTILSTGTRQGSSKQVVMDKAGNQQLFMPYSRESVTSENSTRETGVLQPGGSFDFPNGSSVIAGPETFSGEPIVVYSEKVAPDRTPEPLPEQVEVVGEYFRIGTVGENITAGSGGHTFLVTLPIPAGVDAHNVGIASFLPENDYYTPEQSQYWTLSAPGRSRLLNGKPFTTPSDLFEHGTIFVLVRFRNLPTTTILSSKQNKARPIFKTLLTPRAVERATWRRWLTHILESRTQKTEVSRTRAIIRYNPTPLHKTLSI
jgi:hypothetical protein